MSHFTRIRTKLKDAETVKKVLRDMGFDPQEAPRAAKVAVRGWAGQTRPAEFKVAKGAFDIGFVRAGEHYEMVGDFSGMHLDQTEFTHDLNRRYARETILASAAAQGFNVVEEVQQTDGSLKLVVERWG